MKNIAFSAMFSLIGVFTSQAQNILLSEDFDSGSLPDTWFQETAASDGGWLLGSNTSLQSEWWSIAPHGNFIATNDDACDCDKSADYLVMPSFDLSEVSSAILQFAAFYDGATFQGSTEVATIEYSLNEGGSWAVLETVIGTEDGAWDLHSIGLGSLTGNSDVWIAFRYNDDGGWMFGWAIDDVVVFEPTGLDAAMTALNMPQNVNVPGEVGVTGTVGNVGAETIYNFDITWSDGTNDFTQAYPDINLQSGESMEFTHEEPFSMTESGTATLEVSVGNVNGMDDDVAENNVLYHTFSGVEYGTLEDGGIDREFIYYHPSSATENCPLVFVCHGYGGSAQGIMNYSEFNALADEFGFAVCYPQGIEDSYGNPFFNVGYDFQFNETVDDVAYVTHLAEYLQANNSLDSELVFCTGMSNGGDFCYLLACEASETFRAVAPIAGMIMQDIMDACNPFGMVSILEVHGTDDNVTYFEGDPQNLDDWGAYPSIPATIDFFTNMYGLELQETVDFPNTVSGDGSTVSADRFGLEGSCPQVWLYTVDGGGHDWPGAWGNMDISASREAWLFFDQICAGTTEVVSLESSAERVLVEILDLLGRKAVPEMGQLRLYIYSDGSVEKRVQMED